jgi:hypothetical protein
MKSKIGKPTWLLCLKSNLISKFFFFIGIYSSEFIISAVLKQAIIGAPFRIELWKPEELKTTHIV